MSDEAGLTAELFRCPACDEGAPMCTWCHGSRTVSEDALLDWERHTLEEIEQCKFEPPLFDKIAGGLSGLGCFLSILVILLLWFGGSLVGMSGWNGLLILAALVFCPATVGLLVTIFWGGPFWLLFLIRRRIRIKRFKYECASGDHRTPAR
jgi:hypothetical protein